MVSLQRPNGVSNVQVEKSYFILLTYSLTYLLNYSLT